MRSRNIKPGFFDNENLAEGGPCAQVLFEGLWCLADREGILENRPKRIQAKIFPYYEPKDFGGKDINQLLEFLHQKAFIVFYRAESLDLIYILKFRKHQSPHKTEKISILPKPSLNNGDFTLYPPLNNGEVEVDSPNHNGESRPDSLIHRFTDSIIKDSSDSDESPPPVPQKPQEEKPKETPKKSKNSGYSQDFLTWWSAMPHREDDSKGGAYRHWQKHIKAKILPPLEKMLLVAEKHNTSQVGAERRFICSTRKFLEERRWESYLDDSTTPCPNNGNGTGGAAKPKLLPARPDCAKCQGSGMLYIEVIAPDGSKGARPEICGCKRGEDTGTIAQGNIFVDREGGE